MPLINLAWKHHFFWDGRSTSLREQVLHPIMDPIEMGESPDTLIAKLEADPGYVEAFRKAFRSGRIDLGNLGLALESYLLTLTSYDSDFDRALIGEHALTEVEKRGFELFSTEFEPRSGAFGADCFHCHGGALFTDNRLHNNGLQVLDDSGRQQHTQDEKDRGLFSTPSLRIPNG